MSKSECKTTAQDGENNVVRFNPLLAWQIADVNGYPRSPDDAVDAFVYLPVEEFVSTDGRSGGYLFITVSWRRAKTNQSPQFTITLPPKLGHHRPVAFWYSPSVKQSSPDGEQEYLWPSLDRVCSDIAEERPRWAEALSSMVRRHVAAKKIETAQQEVTSAAVDSPLVPSRRGRYFRWQDKYVDLAEVAAVIYPAYDKTSPLAVPRVRMQMRTGDAVGFILSDPDDRRVGQLFGDYLEEQQQLTSPPKLRVVQNCQSPVSSEAKNNAYSELEQAWHAAKIHLP